MYDRAQCSGRSFTILRTIVRNIAHDFSDWDNGNIKSDFLKTDYDVYDFERECREIKKRKLILSLSEIRMSFLLKFYF